MLFASLVGILAASQVVAVPHIQKRDHSHLAKRNFGRVTFFRSTDSDPNLACQGYYYSDESFPLVALSTSGDFSQDKCGQWITVTYNGKSVSAQVQDACATCSNGQIDLSPGAMRQLDSNYETTGQFNAEWSFGGGGGSSPKEETTTKEEPKPTPTPEPTPTPTPEPTSTSTWTPSTESSTSSSTSSSSIATLSSSSTLLPSASLLNATTSLNATVSANATALLNATASLNATAALPSASGNATVSIAPGTDHVVEGTGAVEDGNLSGVGNLVVSVGRLIALAVGAN
ncbi:hypothetical protein CcaverHIS002_0703120 [Cutaneotrichosporon cavernicola]|uniref:RlpA-like protein double-psi beta-barrel domain-containing protein n=1 Tax=Cutaneotrichosporon cavernicola TaxID=279322 RepID=A0AA48LAA5_9TREE|nr:uncharacterized protein CcaverHIS019_0703190 [Cutaneotrichosporon cavernicola]BEI86966.1 hypothetical protein CcaverHIS002_0703120 [Cutaneotrichosporon cavernicola]BEI94738.1 hypothetical protein CcaverHIS019_0703190 [Cutaneotrichosporon cavernicola]BEJ02514.1 hypothetical protein CcaverHIS631_0703090 [Cutaneotrichosporon cavernicola]BEJ10272.1 hypothetical protein CcaverHIS641_0703070 [Cutaneotrichosporon cavernicola]